jgi:hypothetical protein
VPRHDVCNLQENKSIEISGRNTEGINHHKGLYMGGRIILKWIVGKLDRVVWTGLIWIKIGKSYDLS